MKPKKCWALWSLIVFDSVLYYFLERKLYYHILYFFSLWIVKSLQLYRRRQITELHKYCLVWFFFFFLEHIFSLFLHLTNLRISYLLLLERFPRHVVLLLIKFQVMPGTPSFSQFVTNWYIVIGATLFSS